MMPVYNKHPHQMNIVPDPQYYFPGVENGLHHTRMDVHGPPMPYGYWSLGGNYGYPAPCHSCCHFGSFLGYTGFRPHYPNQMPHLPCCGNYPYHPAHYARSNHIPPPRCSVDQSSYEYDKSIRGNHHCCGCPNHPWSWNHDNRVKVEEQEPEVEKESQAVVPVHSKNYPYPIIWIPQESMRNQECVKPSESEMGSRNQAPTETKAPEKVKAPGNEPMVWNGSFPLGRDGLRSFMQNRDGKKVLNDQDEGTWKYGYPLDIDGLRSLMQSLEGEKEQCKKKEDKSSEFPLPIFWMPFHGKQQEEGKKEEMDTAQRHADERLPNLKFVPSKLHGHEAHIDKPEMKDENTSRDLEEKSAKQKIIPVKQIEHQGPKEIAEETGENGTDSTRDISEDKAAETSKRKQSSSPPKLPPVCLRVDPLPKKKYGNGNSRSPSPPNRKGQRTEMSKDSSKVPVLSSSGELDSNKNQAKTIHVEHKVKREDEAGKGKSACETCPNTRRTENIGAAHGSNLAMESGSVESCRADEASKLEKAGEDKHKPARKKISDVEAAAAIQSAYRGYEVRRWEPLKKLKQMAMIREQMVDVKSQIQAIEASGDLQKDEKQISVIGEMIMSLLLKLDAVQGLHPSIRDTRKSLARELMGLQEKLDSLKISKSIIEEPSAAKSVNVPRNERVGDGSVKEEFLHKISSESSNGDMKSDQSKLSELSDLGSESDVKECAAPLPASEDPNAKEQNGRIEQTEVPKEEESQVEGALLSTINNRESAPMTTTEGVTLETQEEEKAPNGIVTYVPSQPATEEETSQKEEVEEHLKINVYGDDKIELVKDLQQTIDEHAFPGMEETIKIEGQGHEIVNDIEIGADLSSNSISTAETDISSPPEPVAELLGLPTVAANEGGLKDQLPLRDEDPLENEADKHVLVSESCHLETASSPVEEPARGKLPQAAELPQTEEKSDGNESSAGSVESEKATKEGNENSLQQIEGHANENSVLEIDRHTQEIVGGITNQGNEPESESAASDISFEEPKLHGQEIRHKEEADQIEDEEDMQKKLQYEKPEQGLVEENVLDIPEREEAKEPEFPTDSKISVEDTSGRDKKLIEENQRLREMMEKLMEAGKEQLDVISTLTCRVKDLEKKLSKRKRVKMGQPRNPRTKSCGKQLNNSVKEMPTSVVM